VTVDQAQGDSDETRRLLADAQAGDPRAFDRLFARYRDALHAFVDLHLDPRVRARVDPSDVVQETQLDTFGRLDDFLRRRPMPFRVWLRKTAYERLLKVRRFHRAARRAVGREAPQPDRSSLLLARQFLAAGPSPSQQLAEEEVARRVRAALDRLDEVDREVLLMRNLEGLSYQEVGCLLDVEPAAARKRYGRALLRLRRLLFDEGLLEERP
jgi:RNA polymerase sigma-70 factor, ECF subfamily